MTTSQLRDVHESRRLGPYLTALRNRRSYVWYVATSELRHRQITTVLGNAWHLLNPALSILVYYVIFGIVLETDRGVDNFFLFLTIGLFTFRFTNLATVQGAKSIVGNRGLMRVVWFPRVMLPTASTLTETLASIPVYAVIVVVALVSGEPVTWRWLVVPVVFLTQTLFNAGAAMTAARMTTHFRDTLQFLPFIFRLLRYGSGVFFSVDAYVTNSDFALFFLLNPVYDFLTLTRWCFIDTNVVPIVLYSTAAWTVIALVGGFMWFRAAEERYDGD